MESMHKISDSSLYTDFNDLARLRAKSGTQSDEASKEVAKQFEAMFLQMMLKSMRDASVPGADGDSTGSDQTRFYQDMFDKQIAMDLANNNSANGVGIATVLEKEFSAKTNAVAETTESKDVELVLKQINRPSSSINTELKQYQNNNEQE